MDNILDLRNDWDELDRHPSESITAIIYSRVLMREVDADKKKYRPEYYITRFISDLAKSTGFNGILYSSSINHDDNLVLFNHNETSLLCKDRPSVKIFEKLFTEF